MVPSKPSDRDLAFYRRVLSDTGLTDQQMRSLLKDYHVPDGIAVEFDRDAFLGCVEKLVNRTLGSFSVLVASVGTKSVRCVIRF